MSFLGKVLREPLVHFLLLGAAIFFADHLLREAAEPIPPRESIVVSEGRIGQLAEIFARTWQRPPTAEELQGLVEAFIKEEVYYREAVKLGLDRDDTIIRRRLQQKMEFLVEPPAEALQADDAKLESYLAANRERFRVDPRLAFRQVFIRVDQSEVALQRASALLDELRRGAAPAGDPSLLPGEMPLSPLRAIDRTFGGELAEALAELPLGEWSGPVTSAYGLHLVRVEAREAGYDPALAEVRDLVLQEWQHEQRQAFAEQTYRTLREGYVVILPDGMVPSAVGEASQ
jgi:hypothetical protein